MATPRSRGRSAAGHEFKYKKVLIFSCRDQRNSAENYNTNFSFIFTNETSYISNAFQIYTDFKNVCFLRITLCDLCVFNSKLEQYNTSTGLNWIFNFKLHWKYNYKHPTKTKKIVSELLLLVVILILAFAVWQ